MAFPCYYCRKPTHVLDTQAHIRTRGCKYCGKTFMTREMVDLAQHVGNDKPDKEMQAAADKKYEKELAAEWETKKNEERQQKIAISRAQYEARNFETRKQYLETHGVERTDADFTLYDAYLNTGGLSFWDWVRTGRPKSKKEETAVVPSRDVKQTQEEEKELKWLEREREVYQRHVAAGGFHEKSEHPAAGRGVLSFREFVSYRLGPHAPRRFLDNPDLIPED